LIVGMLAARYRFGLVGAWRWVWSVGLMLSFYFDAFVLVTQLFTKVPALMRTTPVPGAPGGAAFGAVQFVVLVAFVVLTLIAARRYRHAGQGGAVGATKAQA
jgi:hypothetical protein